MPLSQGQGLMERLPGEHGIEESLDPLRSPRGDEEELVPLNRMETFEYRQRYWSGLPFLLQGIFPAQGSNLRFLHLLHWQAGSFTIQPPGKSFLKSYLNFLFFILVLLIGEL